MYMNLHKEIYTTKEFKLYKTNEESYMIKFNESSEKLINSLVNTNFLNNITITSDNKTIIIKVKTLITLEDYKKNTNIENNTRNLSYHDCLHCLYSLTKQLEYLLEKESACFYTYEPENIIIINRNIYLHLSTSHLVEFKNKKLRLNKLFEKTENISPEIKNIKNLPFEINYKTMYYSLGKLLVYFLFDKDKYEEDMKKRMEPIEGTKLYYYLLRCIDENIEKRCLLFI